MYGACVQPVTQGYPPVTGWGLGYDGEPRRTLVTPAQLAPVLVEAAAQLQLDLNVPLLALLLAQWALETARGASMWCNNLGNVKATPKWVQQGNGFCYIAGAGESNLTAAQIAYELANAKPRTDGVEGPDAVCGSSSCLFYASNPQARFRSYADLLLGAVGWLSFMRGNYFTALAVGWSGDVTGYSRALRQRGYYTVSEAHYTRHLRSVYNEMVPIAAKALGLPAVVPGEPSRALPYVLAALAVGGAAYVMNKRAAA